MEPMTASSAKSEPVNDPGRTVIRVGLDLGKVRDFLAIVIAEEVRQQRTRTAWCEQFSGHRSARHIQ